MNSVRTVNIVAFLLLSACAKQGMPPGGPIDETPPEIIQTLPAPGETFVDPNTVVEVWFDEGIQAASAVDAIFITPFPGEGVRYRIRGRRLRIRFPRPLRKDRTVVITLGTGIKDYRNNAMAASYTLAFSTGSVLDEGEIKGAVFGHEDARGIGVWAYTTDLNPEPDPSQIEPDYVIQCETNGSFHFSNLSPGIYRLFAVRDRLADRLYQAGDDEIGVTFKDVRLAREGPLFADSLYFRTTRADTAGPTVIRTTVQDRGHVAVRYDEEVVFVTDSAGRDVRMTAKEDTTEILGVDAVYVDPMNAQVLHVLVSDQTPGRRYRAIVKNVRDKAGNPADTAFGKIEFDGVSQADTTHPKLLKIEPAPGAPDFSLNGLLRFIFSEPMDAGDADKGFTVTDTSGVKVDGLTSWPSPADMVYRPSVPFESRMTYSVSLSSEYFRDWRGHALPDTSFQFQTLNADTLSEILGMIIDPDAGAVGEIHVLARQVEDRAVTYSDRIPGSGPYRLTGVLPGQYLIEIYRDRDNNGAYSPGIPFPFKPAERFVVYQDTIKVRSRWPNEGNDIRLPGH